MPPRTHSLFRCLKRRTFSFPHQCHDSTRTRRFNTLEPVANLSDIRNRCQTTFSARDLQSIAWVGVFGSFALGNQNRSSDVDLLLGFGPGVTENEMDRMRDITGLLQDVMSREVDAVYMRHTQSLDYMKAQALLCSKTVYGSSEWLRDHQPRARRLLLDTHARFNAALRLEKEILEKVSRVSEKELFETPTIVGDLVSDLDKLIHIWHPDDTEATAIHRHFEDTHKWTCIISSIIERYQGNGVEGLSLNDREILWESSTVTIRDNSVSLERVYIPLLEELFEMAGVEYADG